MNLVRSSRHHPIVTLVVAAFVVIEIISPVSRVRAQVAEPAPALPTEPAISATELPASSPTDQAEQRMSAMLGVFASSARTTRHFLLATALGSGVALLPAGLVLSHRHNPLQRQTGIGMIVGGAAPLAFSFLWSRPSRMELLSNSFEAMRVPGGDNRELVRRTEQAWQAASESARKRRNISGAINVGLGLASTVVGIVFLLSHSISGMSRNTQYIVGSSLLGPGVPLATNGTRSLLVPSNEETSWAAYRAGSGSYTLSRASAPVGFSAIRHGGVAMGGFAF